jgi:hypothetical protein
MPPPVNPNFHNNQYNVNVQVNPNDAQFPPMEGMPIAPGFAYQPGNDNNLPIGQPVMGK